MANTLSIYFHTFCHIKCIKSLLAGPLRVQCLISLCLHTLLVLALGAIRLAHAALTQLHRMVGLERRAATRHSRVSQCISIYITLPYVLRKNVSPTKSTRGGPQSSSNDHIAKSRKGAGRVCGSRKISNQIRNNCGKVSFWRFLNSGKEFWLQKGNSTNPTASPEPQLLTLIIISIKNKL